MNICIVFSPNWIRYVAISLFALLTRNQKNKVKVYLVTDKLQEEDFFIFDNVFNNFKNSNYIYVDLLEEFEKRINDRNITTKFTKFTLYRLLLPETIKEDKILYIDADTIVNDDITNLYNIDMKNNWIMGCMDMGVQEKHKMVLGLSSDIYINAGIMLMDLKKIRDNFIPAKWLRFINRRFYLGHDQDVINMVCKGHIGLIDLKYNTSLSTNVNVKDIKIMHYAGNKPWDTNNVPHYDIWQYWEDKYYKFLKINNSFVLPSIPRVIHYCWFGGNEKPDLVKKCIKTWKQYLKDYLIFEWNESNFDVNIHPFVKEAYSRKLYAFVNDYVRMYVLYHYGGITLDADVEVLKPLDKYLKHKCFTGYEAKNIPVCAVIGSIPGHKWIKIILDYYNTAEVNMRSNTQIIKELSKPYIKYNDKDSLTYILNDVVIYPSSVFAPYDHFKRIPIPDASSYTIHHFQGSWLKYV